MCSLLKSLQSALLTVCSKSKLRKKEAPSLGPQYRGARISRAALDESDDGAGQDDEDDDGDDSEEYDDPETADLERDHVDADEEIDSDEAFCESDGEKFDDFTFRGSSKPKQNGLRKKRPVAADFLSASEDEDGVLDGGAGLSPDEFSDEDSNSEKDGAGFSDEESSQSGSAEDDDDEDEDEDEDVSSDEEDGDDDAQRAELRKIMSEGQKNIVATMSQAAKADADKGVAVRQQRRAFDSLLNIRIRLQKALVAVNTLNTVDEDQEVEKEAYEAAEEAAIKLWNTIDNFRTNILPEGPTKAGQKRKRDNMSDMSSQQIWEEMEVTEGAASKHRKRVLEKWSSKVRSSTAAATTRKLGSAPTQSLIDVLEDQLLSSDRLVKRTQTPRSCAPVQAAKKVNEDLEIYDDADFYQLLLKELVEQRTTDSSAPGSAVPTVRWAAIKEAKTRKQVDRKASKGRKLRFTVHEKIQNFMAPEDRRSWEQDAIDRFFGTLFGQKMELKEDEVSDEEMGDVSVEEEGLKLFRS